MNNTVKIGSQKGDRDTRVWFSPAGPPPDLKFGLQVWEERRGDRELPDGGTGATNSLANFGEIHRQRRILL